MPNLASGSVFFRRPSMKVPPKRKGNPQRRRVAHLRCSPSMKVPPKRKGNTLSAQLAPAILEALNESPSEKEGKFGHSCAR